MTKLALLAPLLASFLGACATPQAPAGPDNNPAIADDLAVRCHAESLGNLVSQVATSALAEQALHKATARTVRWIQPGTAVTMDYRFDRLNIYLDATNHVTKFTCG